MLRWMGSSLDVAQPYRLQGTAEWPRLWAASLLVGFVLIEGSRDVRSLAAICLLYVAYHALVTAFAQWTLPRYVLGLSPMFLMITAAAGSVLAREARALSLRTALRLPSRSRLDLRPERIA